MKTLYRFSAAIGALAVIACTDAATRDVTSPDLSIRATKNPTPTNNPNGPVWVLGNLDLNLGIEGTVPGENAHPQGKGTCRDENGNIGDSPTDTIWYNDKGHATGNPFCKGSTGIASTFTNCEVTSTSLPATYSLGGGGSTGYPVDPQTSANENLNFHSDLIPVDTAQFIHYAAPTKKGLKGVTTAKSQTAFSFSCTEADFDGYVALGDLDGSSGNLFSSSGDPAGTRHVNLNGGLAVSVYATGDGPYTAGDLVGTGTLTSMYWAFRSRL